jgi:hypothetical protein
MRKIALSVVFAICILAVVAFPAKAVGSISTTLWGDGTIQAGRTGVDHVSVQIISGVAEDVSVQIKAIDIDNTKPLNIVVILNGMEICRYSGKEIRVSPTCFIGNLNTGDTVDVAIKYHAIKPGLDEWIVSTTHDGWVTSADFALTILPKK